MIISVIGGEGSMGKRYQAILKGLGHGCFPIDVNSRWLGSVTEIMNSNGIIIATPTDTHLDYIQMFAALGKPILCEKPLAKNKSELETIRRITKQYGLNLTMMMQYQLLDNADSTGSSFYNYFRHGNDGLYWDCFQVIALARDEVLVDETSAVWRCQLNGKKLDLSDMDQAYIDYVDQWVNNPGQDIDRLISLHEKVQAFQEAKTVG